MTPKPQENNLTAGNNPAVENVFINKAFEKDNKNNLKKNLNNENFLNANNKIILNNDKFMNSNNNNNNDNNKQIVDFDDLLPHLGEFGKYQKLLFLSMIPFAFFVVFVYFSGIFLALVPEEHYCNVPELDSLPLEKRLALSIPRTENGYSKCLQYDVDFNEILKNGTSEADPKWPVISCRNGWKYNFSEIPYETIATELDWVCDDAALPTIAQSIFFVGAIVGGLLFGWIADRFGRVPSLAGCNLIGFVAGCATAYATNFWQFALARFFVGFAFDNCFTMIYILVLEYVGPKWRTFVANMSIAIFFTTASTALPWIAYFIADWKMFAIVTSAPLALAVFTPLLIPESARWLVSQGKFERAIKILKKFEKVNGKNIDPEIYKEFSDNCIKLQQEESENSNYSILDLFKTPRLRKITILLIVIWMSISLVFDGHVRNVGSLGLDLFITFTVACATELPADTFLTLTLDRWGRRWLAFGSMVLSGVFSLLAAIVPGGPISASLAICGRFCVNISYNIGLQYAAEILPTVVRAQGVAFVHIMGYVASIVAPFVVYLAYISPVLPLLVLGVIGIFGGILSLFLPETLGRELPQTLTDGEEFGRGQGIFDFPCLGGRADDDDNDIEKSKQMPYFVRGTVIGASLRASTRGEVSSSMLQRSTRLRYSTRSIK